MTKFKLFIIFFILVFSLTSCQSIKDGLQGKKKDNSDEFLVQKKNPLVLPPDFDDIPIPGEEESEEETNQEDTDVEDLLGIYSSNESGNDVEENKSVENSILEKINEN